MTDAQLNPHDELGWLVDRMADPAGDRRLCPKACARAKARLLEERAMLRTAADRDRELTAEIDRLEAEIGRLRADPRVSLDEWPMKRGVTRQAAPPWHFGKWLAPGLAGGGAVSVNPWRYHDGECLVGISAMANLTVDQARLVARALLSAAALAAAEDARGVGE